MMLMLLAASSLPPMFSLFALILVGVVGISLLLLKLRQSLLVGYFICGIAIANTGLLEAMSGPQAAEAIGSMSEFGVMWLLFVIGMEFSFRELGPLRRFAFLGGTAQMSLTMVLAALGAWMFFDFAWQQVVVIAVACALSSTAISIKLYQDMGITAGSGARLALGVTIFQDIFIIIFLVLLPVLFPGGSSGSQGTGSLLLLTLGKGVAFVAMAWFLARAVIPRVLHAVARTRSRELFTLTVAGLCIGVAYLAAIMDLSLVLGAFVAGMAVSESMYKHRIMSEVGPFKDIFLMIFFVSVGLGINVHDVARDWLPILSITLALLVGKTVLVALIARLLGLRWGGAIAAAIGLGSASEFSLVLLGKSSQLTAWPGEANQPLMAAMALSMAMVPVLMGFAAPLWEWLEKHAPNLFLRQRAITELPHGAVQLSDHAIVCGYGPVGRQLMAALSNQGIPAMIIDLNPNDIRSLRASGHPALFADASQLEVWDLCGVERARLVAFTFPATGVIKPALRAVREKNPVVPILVRTAYSSRAAPLTRAGASIVIEDEQETGRAVVHSALHALELHVASEK